MPSTTLKRRWTEDGMRERMPKKQRKIRKQKFYHSSSEDEDGTGARDAPRGIVAAKRIVTDTESSETFNPNLTKQGQTTKPGILKKTASLSGSSLASAAVDPAIDLSADVSAQNGASESDEEEVGRDEFDLGESGSEGSNHSETTSVSETSTNTPAKKLRKRHDPEAFAASMSKILNTKLTSQKRSEPILSRSKDAQETNKHLSDHKLTQKAYRQVLTERNAAKEKGRVKDVLGLNDANMSTAETTAQEKALRRTAQKGVIKLFNAVRAAQVKGEQAERMSKAQGMVGMEKREEMVKEMSKQGFLDMITGGAGKEGSSVEA